MSKQKKSPSTPKAKVHPALEGLDINIDSFGQIKSNMDMDQLLEFLNREMKNDKKLNPKPHEPK